MSEKGIAVQMSNIFTIGVVTLLSLGNTLKSGQQKEKMNDYVQIDAFNQGWKFFTKKISVYDMEIRRDTEKFGKFPCSEFGCDGCGDWLDADDHNRNVYKVSY